MVELRFGLLITNTPHDEWYAPLSATPKSIGRSKAMQIRVPKGNPSVSREHAKVWCDRQGAWICDLGSTYGTTVNGVKLMPHRETRITHGDRVLLGTLELTLVDEQELIANVLLDDGGMSDSNADTMKMSQAVDASRQALSTLTNAERDVLLWVSRGYTTPDEIAEQLIRSPHTVRTQLNSIFQKLGVHSRDELVGYILRTQRGKESGGNSATI